MLPFRVKWFEIILFSSILSTYISSWIDLFRRFEDVEAEFVEKEKVGDILFIKKEFVFVKCPTKPLNSLKSFNTSY